MVVIDRRAARLFRAAVRRCFDGPATRADAVGVQVRAEPGGLLVHAAVPDIVLCWRKPGDGGGGVFTFPLSVFGEFEGRAPDPVEIELLRPDTAVARWSDRGRRRELEVPLLDPGSVPTPPEPPRKFSPAPTGFLQAFDDAASMAAGESSKYAIGRVQVRGGKGTVVGTDTRQLLVGGGFRFPFKEDLLLPRCRAFSLPEFAAAENVFIGRTERHLVVRTGDFDFFLSIDKEGRYPDAAAIVPSPAAADSRLTLDAEDARRFLDSLTRRLRAGGSKGESVTLDLSDRPCLRYESEGRVTEVKLLASEFTGRPVRACLVLSQFLRALELRFMRFEVREPDRPVVARDGDRVYVTVPLPSSAALPPRPDDHEVPEEAPVPSRALARSAARSVAKNPIIMPPAEPGGDAFDILGEAEGLRDGLWKVAAHAGKLLRFLGDVCTRQQVIAVARDSLLALAEPRGRGARP